MGVEAWACRASGREHVQATANVLHPRHHLLPGSFFHASPDRGGLICSPGREALSLPTFWVVMATADVLRNEDAPEGEEAASAAFPPRSGV
jgi:hypothetical protein